MRTAVICDLQIFDKRGPGARAAIVDSFDLLSQILSADSPLLAGEYTRLASVVRVFDASAMHWLEKSRPTVLDREASGAGGDDAVPSLSRSARVLVRAAAPRNVPADEELKRRREQNDQKIHVAVCRWRNAFLARAYGAWTRDHR